jgi:hypothetical protein
MQIKLTPFYLFLILLIVLVISMMFGHWWINDRGINDRYRSLDTFQEEHIEESFTDFNRNINVGSTTYIPQYSNDTNNKLTSLFDNLFFDVKNGNLIEVQITQSDTSGNSIQKLFVTPRSGSTTSVYPKNDQTFDNSGSNINIVNESSKTNIESNYSNFLYSTMSNNVKYKVLYISWDTTTFLVIFNPKKLKEVSPK